MNWTIHFSIRARSEIRQVLQYTWDHFGETKYLQYHRLINEAVERIQRNPLAPPARVRADIGPGIHSYHISRRGARARHLFLYRLIEQTVLIGAFAHDSMDLPMRGEFGPDDI